MPTAVCPCCQTHTCLLETPSRFRERPAGKASSSRTCRSKQPWARAPGRTVLEFMDLVAGGAFFTCAAQRQIAETAEAMMKPSTLGDQLRQDLLLCSYWNLSSSLRPNATANCSSASAAVRFTSTHEEKTYSSRQRQQQPRHVAASRALQVLGIYVCGLQA